LLGRVNELHGVEAAGATGQLPLGGNENVYDFNIEGRPEAAPGAAPNAGYQIVTPGYFRAMNIPVLRGRSLTERDTADSPQVLVINETFARLHFPGEDPVGRRVVSLDRADPVREIVGVVGDVRHQGLEREAYADVYVPHAQDPRRTMDVVVRTASANPRELEPALRGVIREVGKDQLIWQTRTMSELVSQSVEPRRFSMLLLGAFAGVALRLAAVGIDGVRSYSVTQRTHEIGVRLALGAQGSDVLRMVVGRGMALTLAGVCTGLAGAFLLTRVMRGLLYGVSATDPLTFAGVSLLLMVIALLACYLPARRATKVDPMVALRYE
ncbi:MAG: FtsX-like permease family protein, partial [Pyrinomonadaceae bacterium]